ncbi:MAG: hypothetical protein GF315_07195 [candidate division Zixibacteria bacterium]|nr:hypothetical protein [candidate division Zixibacteria bacterium]
MKQAQRGIVVLSLILAFSFVNANAQQLLVWDNDNYSHYIDPESGSLVGCEQGIQNAILDAGYSYNPVSTLPSDLSQYDIVFVELGVYCVD